MVDTVVIYKIINNRQDLFNITPSFNLLYAQIKFSVGFMNYYDCQFKIYHKFSGIEAYASD